MNIYLDIDGTLLHKDGTPANYLFEFLDYVVNNHDVYWLTTHCRGGVNCAVEHMTMRNNISPEIIALLNCVHETDWQALKAEAIDYTKDFIWLDDYIMESDENILKQHNVAQNGINVNLRENPDELKEILNWLKEKTPWHQIKSLDLESEVNL